jgi:hypothetical protein
MWRLVNLVLFAAACHRSEPSVNDAAPAMLQEAATPPTCEELAARDAGSNACAEKIFDDIIASGQSAWTARKRLDSSLIEDAELRAEVEQYERTRGGVGLGGGNPFVRPKDPPPLPQAIASVLDARAKEIHACYTRRAARDPSLLHGRVRVRFDVQPNGTTAFAMNDGSHVDTRVLLCVESIIQKATFPSREREESFTYAIDFP